MAHQTIVDTADPSELLVSSQANRLATARAVALSSSIEVVPGTSFVPNKNDSGRLLKTTSGSAVTITIGSEASIGWSANSRFEVLQYGAGQVSFVGDGATIQTPETHNIAKQYAMAVAIYLGADVWVLSGYLEAA